ncbi:MAG: ABC transporter ATP-binding protein [Dehalococcoidia bacterium]|nr:ABC transporter ATP-binding protein [Dehalococcoidia bacterium]
MEYVIETENLVKRFGNGVTALDGVSLGIRKGDVVGYVGPNGAGKTTTIKILTRLIRPTSGHAYIGGVDVNKGSKEALQNVGALIEVPGVYEYLTPHEMLTYFGKVYRMNSKQIDQRIKETLELVKLSDWEHKKVGSFSTGMQRRLVIAKAIFHKPEILILDEPVLGLDPKGIRDVRELIRQFHSEGITVFLSSHLLGEVAEVCNRVILLDKGRVIASDSIESIGNRLERRAINVKFSRPLSSEQSAKLESIELIDSIEATDNVVRIHFDGKPDTSYRILRELVSLDFEIVSYNSEGMGLEDYYLSVMGDEEGVN